MHPGIQARFAAHGGFILRHEALDLGVTPSGIAHLLRSGAWVLLRRGAYADAELWQSLDVHRAQPLLRARAAVAQMRRGWVLSHDSSAHALGMDILRPEHAWVHVTRPGLTNAWTKAGVKHHLARFDPLRVVDVDGLPVLGLARTAVDIARERGDLHGLVAFDAAMRMGVAREAFDEVLDRMVSWPGIGAARRCRDRADPGAQSVLESLARDLVEELGIGPVETQFPVRTSAGVKWCDLRVGNHVFEADGRVKYLGLPEGGVADQPAGDVVFEEKKRERLVRGRGLGVSRILWEDLWGSRRDEARIRLRAEYRITRQQLGPDLSAQLAHEADEIRGRRSA